MKFAVRILGGLLCLFAVVGILAAWAGRGLQMSWPGYEPETLAYTLRSWADFVVLGALLLGGFALLSGRDARWWALAALALALTKLGFDLALGDVDTSRGRTVRSGSVVAAFAAAITVGLAWAARVLARRSSQDRDPEPPARRD